jgi:adenosylcobinamide kinase/adenosylcobinamide-phosphate guanylyltransferase
METAPSLIFITGGVRSGKSSFAERAAVEIAEANGGRLYYIATGVPFDSEMKDRIKRHQQDRGNGTHHWITVEQPISIGELAPHVQDKDILLLDCVTTLLNNELYAVGHQWDQLFLDLVYEKIIDGIMLLKRQAGTLIVVSNEVLNEPIMGSTLVLIYKRLLGHLHQRLIKESDQAYLVEAGIPVAMKKVLA